MWVIWNDDGVYEIWNNDEGICMKFPKGVPAGANESFCPNILAQVQIPAFLKGWGRGGIDLTKDPKKGGMAKLRKGRKDCVRKGGCC